MRTRELQAVSVAYIRLRFAPGPEMSSDCHYPQFPVCHLVVVVVLEIYYSIAAFFLPSLTVSHRL